MSSIVAMPADQKSFDPADGRQNRRSSLPRL